MTTKHLVIGNPYLSSCVGVWDENLECLFWNSKTDVHSKNPGASLRELLQNVPHALSSISQVWTFSGPGSFSGLRNGASFAHGLAMSLRRPLFGISTWALFQKPVVVSLRPQLTVNLDTIEKHRNTPALFIESQEKITLTELSQHDISLLASASTWPTAEQVTQALRLVAANPPEFELNYGYEPKFKTISEQVKN